MLLSDIAIAQIGPGIINPFDPACVQPASYDLSLHRDLLVPFEDWALPSDIVGYGMDLRVDNPADYMRPAHCQVGDGFGSGYILRPGKAVLGCTQEVITCPDHLAIRVEGKSSLARMFLLPHVAAGWIDPGFKGQITLELVNLGPWPVKLYEGMKIAQMNFTHMVTPVAAPYGSEKLGSHYQGQMGPTNSAGKRSK